MTYRTSKHCKFLCLYHVISVTKYRHNTLWLLKYLKLLIVNFFDELGTRIKALAIEFDHIHLLLGTYPDANIRNLTIRLKQYLTYNIYRINYNRNLLQSRYWYRNKLCSDGTFTCTIGNASKETTLNYINLQR